MSKSRQTPDSDARMSGFRQDVLAHFHDREYRQAYVDEFLNTTIASQIRALREHRGWTQAELATRAGTGQSRISELENVNYESWTISSLRSLAEAFDVALAVCFKGFTARLADIEQFSPAALGVPSYTDDLFLSVGAKAPPRLSDTSPLVPLVANLAQFVAHFNAGAVPDSAPDFQQNAVSLLETVGRMYRNDSKQYREFQEWLAGLAAALGTSAQKKTEQAAAELKKIDEMLRLTEENRALREEIRTLRIAAAEAQKQQRIAEIEAQRDQHIAANREAARQATELIITTFRDAVLGWITGERERIEQLKAAATEKSDMTVDQVIREWDDSWQRVELGVRTTPVPT